MFALRDDELSRFTAGEKRSERVAGPAAYARLAAEVFRLPALPIQAGVSAWRANAGPPSPP